MAASFILGSSRLRYSLWPVLKFHLAGVQPVTENHSAVVQPVLKYYLAGIKPVPGNHSAGVLLVLENHSAGVQLVPTAGSSEKKSPP